MRASLRFATLLVALLAAHVFSRPMGAAEREVPFEIPVIARVTTYSSSSASGARSFRQKAQESLAFVVEKSGFLLTSYRTLLDPNGLALLHAVEVELLTGSLPIRYQASIIAVEPTINIAILKIETEHDLPISKITPRDGNEAGQAIHAVAGFEGAKPVYASGQITKINSMECYQESMTRTMLEADIKLPDATMGGPVFNDAGEVLAIHTGYEPPTTTDLINVHVDAGQHILPVALAFNIYESLKFKRSLKSPWTGFSVRSLDPTESTIFPTKERFLGGIAIEHVWKDGPASKMGIREGDLLVQFNYYPTHSPADFQKWLYRYGVGHKIELHLIRNGGQYLKLDYVIEERPAWAKPR